MALLPYTVRRVSQRPRATMYTDRRDPTWASASAPARSGPRSRHRVGNRGVGTSLATPHPLINLDSENGSRTPDVYYDNKYLLRT